jgi:hypothetical protein
MAQTNYTQDEGESAELVLDVCIKETINYIRQLVRKSKTLKN